MKMHKPPHPGEFIKEVYLDELGISEREVALKLKVAPSTLNRLIKGKTNLSPEMALRLSITLGRSPESWLSMQDKYSLWTLENELDLNDVESILVSA
jgi:addiction module HigA family antidote